MSPRCAWNYQQRSLTHFAFVQAYVAEVIRYSGAGVRGAVGIFGGAGVCGEVEICGGAAVRGEAGVSFGTGGGGIEDTFGREGRCMGTVGAVADAGVGGAGGGGAPAHLSAGVSTAGGACDSGDLGGG